MESGILKTSIAAILTLFLLSGCSEPELSDAYGHFESVEVIISSEVSGKLLGLDISEGERLERGSVVGQVDTTRVYLQKKELEAANSAIGSQLNKVDAQVRVFQTQLETAHKELERVRALAEESAATARQMDQAIGEVKTLESRIAALEAEKPTIYAEEARLQIQIEQLMDQISRATIVNPIDGTVIQTYSETHELVSSGKPLYKIASLDEMILRVYVSGAQLPSVNLGDEVDVWIDKNRNENEKLSGIVSWISSTAEFTPRMIQTKQERVTQVYAVKVRVQNPEGKIKIGMPGEVQFK